MSTVASRRSTRSTHPTDDDDSHSEMSDSHHPVKASSLPKGAGRQVLSDVTNQPHAHTQAAGKHGQKRGHKQTIVEEVVVEEEENQDKEEVEEEEHVSTHTTLHR